MKFLKSKTPPNTGTKLGFLDSPEKQTEATNELTTPSFSPWKILIADDDESVHVVTEMVLEAFQFNGRKLTFVNAYSMKEAKEKFDEHPDIAVALIDVIMECEDAGLQLVKWAREHLENQHLRIILRTGQPGMAPEEEVINKYEINDYKAKSELSSQKLRTAIISALRSYRDITIIERTREGLEMMLDASANLYSSVSIELFTKGLMRQLVSLLKLDDNPEYVKSNGIFIFSAPDYRIISSFGSFSERIGKKLNDDEIAIVEKAKIAGEKSFNNLNVVDEYIVFSLDSHSKPITIFIKSHRPFTTVDRKLVNVFITKSAMALENILLQERFQRAQYTTIRSLAKLTEYRDNDTGEHIERVESLAETLAKALLAENIYPSTITNEFVSLIGLASTLHDIGKVGISDSILLKPGKLEPEEMAIMKKHVDIGAKILKSANIFTQQEDPFLIMAEKIALAHHEKWDGSGYPNELIGEEIPVEARIMSIVDVYDALGSVRPYKKAWPKEEVIEYFIKGSGRQFDPEITRVFLKLIQQNPA